MRFPPAEVTIAGKCFVSDRALVGAWEDVVVGGDLSQVLMTAAVSIGTAAGAASSSRAFVMAVAF